MSISIDILHIIQFLFLFLFLVFDCLSLYDESVHRQPKTLVSFTLEYICYVYLSMHLFIGRCSYLPSLHVQYRPFSHLLSLLPT